jgi:hypothetical protein
MGIEIDRIESADEKATSSASEQDGRIEIRMLDEIETVKLKSANS